jgi:hypothetical protein
MDKEFYNEASASKLGWDASWFIPNHFEYDSKLTRAIKEFQREHDLKPDGMCGPNTYRRLLAHIEETKQHNPTSIPAGSEFLYYRGKPIPIKWDKVSTFKDSGSLKLTGRKRSYGTRKRNIKYFVNHWDVCLSSESCVKVLNRRNLSVHFCIDNDGTIHQLADLNDVTYHAGGSHNSHCIGVEISNAYYPKYQNWYKRNGYGERPLITDGQVHGRSMKPFMGFYPVQIEALKALWLACHEGLGIPLEAPKTKWGVDSECQQKKFRGFCSHFHLTRGKIDCAGLDIEKLLKEIK